MKKVVAIAVLTMVVLSGCATRAGNCMSGGAVGGALALGPIGAVAGVIAGHEICK